MQPKLSKITKMIRLNLPEYEINVVERDGKRMIFDFLRRKYVALTPEEWVRQHFTHFLVSQKGYPKTQLQQKTFDQIAAYNLLLHADFLVVSNGLQHYCCQMVYEQRTYRFLTEIPDYSTLTPCR